MWAWQATVQDEAGNAVFNPQVTVYQEDGSTLADIFNEDGSSKENPFIGTTEGFAQFWAESGEYIVEGAYGLNKTENWRVSLCDPKPPFSRIFESRNHFEQSVIEDDVLSWGVYDNGFLLSYVRDDLGTAIVSANGVTGSPAYKPRKQHYGITGPVLIPEHFPNLQEAISAFGVLQDENIELRIQSGYAISQPLVLENGDYQSGYSITSEDDRVMLSSGFQGSVFTGINALLPDIRCLIDASNQISGNGISLNGGGVFVAPGAGIENAWGSGIIARYVSLVKYDGASFLGSGRNGTTGATVTIWGGFGSGEGFNSTSSGYYGPQAAHGAIAGLARVDASGATSYGFRVTDGGIMDLDAAKAVGVGAEAIRAFNVGLINAPNFDGKNSGDKGFSSTNGSILNTNAGGGSGSDFSGAVNYGGFVSAGSLANCQDAKLFGAGVNGLYVANASLVFAGGVNARKSGENGPDSISDFVVVRGGIISLNEGSKGGVSQQPNTILPGGVIFDPRPYTVPTFDLVSNVDNYGLSPNLRDVVCINPTNSRNIRGLSGGYSGARLTILNVSSDFRISLLNENESSTAENRFSLPHGQSFLIFPGCSVTLVYVNDRWRLQASTGAPQMPTFTVSTLPDAASNIRSIVFVSDSSGGASTAFSDGNNWRKTGNSEIVS